MSWSFMPACSSSFGTAKTGPMPISSGSQAANTQPRKKPRGRTPSAFARSADMMSVAEAPSENWEELPAVTVPPALKAGGSLARPSSVVSGRLHSSRSTTTSLRDFWPVALSVTSMVAFMGAISSLNLPSAAQREGKFKDEIAPMKATMEVTDKATGQKSRKEVVVDRDECNRPDTTLEGLAKLPPAFKAGGTVTAGNSSQFSDGASATLIMSAERAKALGVRPLGFFRGCVFAACEPDEMGIGPVFAVPKLLEHAGMKLQDIDVVELNEAFASQVVYCRERLGIDPERLNPNGGSISIGHPYGMTGSRMTGTLLHELRRRKKRWGIVTMCIGGGMGAAGLFEAAN